MDLSHFLIDTWLQNAKLWRGIELKKEGDQNTLKRKGVGELVVFGGKLVSLCTI